MKIRRELPTAGIGVHHTVGFTTYCEGSDPLNQQTSTRSYLHIFGANLRSDLDVTLGIIQKHITRQVIDTTQNNTDCCRR